ncbi:MAG: hypothetical protein E3J96_05175 [Sulfurovum sp.]|nr:MAG: hypothetical protein E3J96_05175 [Sulfurovum sp.]
MWAPGNLQVQFTQKLWIPVSSTRMTCDLYI